MTIKQLKRRLMKDEKFRKGYERASKQWDIKMHKDVVQATFEIMEHINPKAKKALDKMDWLIDGEEVEQIIWRLLKKTRRITQREANPE